VKKGLQFRRLSPAHVSADAAAGESCDDACQRIYLPYAVIAPNPQYKDYRRIEDNPLGRQKFALVAGPPSPL